jgi:acetylornithine deacetylase/succinyl-diaminopimelate desuccinylase-like protein
VALRDAVQLRDEVVELARSLIRVDTSNPPGRETEAAEVLAGYLEAAGVECELLGPDPARQNLVARLRGPGGGPSLLLLGHTDVVPAPAAGWSCPPFDATVRNGDLVGRGAADMKGELAARAVAMAALARSGGPSGCDVVLVAEADEERNTGGVGLSWLVRERADLRCDYALNEGGGLLLELADGRRVVTVSVGEKQVSALRIRVFGTAGHASVPSLADNPLRHAARAVERLLAHRGPVALVPAARRALGVLGAPDADDDEAVARASAQHPVLEHLVPAMARMTVTPTGLHTSEPANVIPPWVDLTCDCRAVPGQSVEDVHEHVGAALGHDLAYEVELTEPLVGGTESQIDTPLYRVCEEYVAERLPGATLLPLLTTGFTDSHWLRQAHGTVAYGFAPVFATDPVAYARGIHNADESVAVDDLAEMAEFHLHVVQALPRAALGR